MKITLILFQSLVIDIVCYISGAAGVFVGEMGSCQVILFDIMYYYTVISLCILGLVFILLLWKLIKPNIDDDFIDERGDII